MSENCSGSCSSCSSDCESRKGPQIVRNANNGKVKKVIAVVSGKGGVGKSLVTSMLAVKANKEGKKAAILDADITGPSIPKSFGLTERVTCNEDGTVMYPETSKNGIKVMSLNLLMEKETDPVIWRGPVIAGVVKQFWEDVDWDETDCMFVDCPPGSACSVNESIGDADYCILVAEPTSFGFHNFKMVYELVNLLGKKCGVVINKQDLPYEPLEKFCIENQVEILARIPYDREAAELSAKGKIVCEEKEEYRVLFRDILKKIGGEIS